MPIEGFSNLSNIPPVKNNNISVNNKPAGNIKFSHKNKSLIYASLGGLAVLGTASTIIYNIRKGRINANTASKFSDAVSETVTETVSQVLKPITLPKKFIESIQKKVSAKKFYSLKPDEIPAGFVDKTKINNIITYDYGDGVKIFSVKKPAQNIKEFVLSYNSNDVAKVTYDLNTKEVSKSVFTDSQNGIVETCFKYDKDNNLLSTSVISEKFNKVSTKTTFPDGTSTIIEQDKLTSKITLEEYYDKDGKLLRSKMDGEWVVVDDTCDLGPKVTISSANESEVFFKNGKAIGKDCRIYTGTVENTSSAGHRMVTTYKDGDVMERTFYPASGNIKSINKKYLREDDYIHVNSIITSNDGSVTHKYYAKIVEKPNYNLRGLFTNSEFDRLSPDKMPGRSYKIVDRNGRKVIEYSNDINIECKKTPNGNDLFILRYHKDELRRLMIKTDGTREIWLPNKSCVAYKKDGTFAYHKVITDAPDGGYTADLKYADGTRLVAISDGSENVVSKVHYSADGQIIS